MYLDELLKNLPKNYSQVDIDLVKKAYKFAAEAHEKQVRESGEPYITHCVAVAHILAEMNLSANVVAAALIHDTIEDNDSITPDLVKKQFGNDIYRLVEGVTKLKTFKKINRDEKTFGPVPIDAPDAPDEPETEPEEPLDPIEKEKKVRERKRLLKTENIRKTILAMAKEPLVIFIKLADRLHNMRTLGYTSPEKQKRIAQETLDIYAAIANRLGIYRFKWELEDLSFRYLHPDIYAEITKSIDETHLAREHEIQKIKAGLEDIMAQANVECEITGRPKHIYSIYQKMVDRGKTLDELRDLRGLRVIVNDIPTCYAALGIIHGKWRPIRGEFDDYIANPKTNNYQSLHTAVIYTDGKPLEVQIRTHEMHQFAEFGFAKHWVYKDRGMVDADMNRTIEMFRNALMMEKEGKSAEEFMEHIKDDLQDRIEVFTPDQDTKTLPIGSTPIDFAYSIHTDIGNRCRGAKVNGRMVPLNYKLKNYDVVEIAIGKQGGPSRDWLNPDSGLVNTQRARSKIRQWFKKQDREQNLIQGRDSIQKEFKRLGITEPDYAKLAETFGYNSTDDMFVAVGCDDLSIGRIITHLSDSQRPDPIPQGRNTTAPDGRLIYGYDKSFLIRFGKCCNPLPGDEIVGYTTLGHGVTIHRTDCPNVARFKNPERLKRERWLSGSQRFPVPITIQAYDRRGLVNEITNILVKEEINMENFNAIVAHNYVTIKAVIDVADITELSRILTKISGVQNVVDAYRDRPG